MSITEAAIVLADGTVFEGEAIGATPPDGVRTGEFVFNTAMSGYQEVISDPSYAGQIITFTYPQVGNYGVNATDVEAPRPHCRGVVVRDLTRRYSNWRAEGDLNGFLETHGIPGIAGVDTRRLTRHLREHGAMPGAFGVADESTIRAAAAEARGTDGIDLVSSVTTDTVWTHPSSTGATRRVVAIDLGIKRTILDHLSRIGEITVVPAHMSLDEVLALGPDGVFISNGPGDPAAVPAVADTLASLLGQVPVFGICMGHQMLAAAIGGTTYKLPFGHHGSNHPVRDLNTGTVEITSQNHNYCVGVDGLENVKVTHRNLNDGTIEGFECLDVPAFSVQYHPEAGPGPHDSHYLFGRFAELMDRSS